MRLLSFLPVLVFSLSIAACSGSSGSNVSSSSSSSGAGIGQGSEGEALFAASGDATPDSNYGVWGGGIKSGAFTFDGRTRFSANQVTYATKCVLADGRESVIASVTVRARIDNDEIAVLESDTDERKTGDISCRASSRPATTKACEKVDGFQTNCFVLDGLTLTGYGKPPSRRSR